MVFRGVLDMQFAWSVVVVVLLELRICPIVWCNAVVCWSITFWVNKTSYRFSALTTCWLLSGIGSGGPYALAAARALIDIPGMSAMDIGEQLRQSLSPLIFCRLLKSGLFDNPPCFGLPLWSTVTPILLMFPAWMHIRIQDLLDSKTCTQNSSPPWVLFWHTVHQWDF